MVRNTQLLEENERLKNENKRLKKENERLKNENELYYNNSIKQEEENSYYVKEITSLRQELSGCEETATNLTVYINEIEKFLSSR